MINEQYEKVADIIGDFIYDMPTWKFNEMMKKIEKACTFYWTPGAPTKPGWYWIKTTQFSDHSSEIKDVMAYFKDALDGYAYAYEYAFDYANEAHILSHYKIEVPE